MGDELKVHGLYTVQDRYFSQFKGDNYWVDNKNENRPNYYLLKDPDGVDWLIPISSQVDNYKAKIKREEEKRGAGNCIYYHIGLVAGKERVFLIGDMFPVDASYIKAPYTINRAHYVIKNKELNSALRSKAMRFLNLITSGKMHSRNNILGIKRILVAAQNKEDT